MSENKIYHLQKLEDFYLQELSPLKRAVLELCCAEGEITIPLALSGIDIVGVEKDNDKLGIAKLKSAEEKINIPFIQADILDFDFGKKFSTIILHIDNIHTIQNKRSLFSLMANVKKFLNTIKNNLEVDGQFIVDMYSNFNPFNNCSELRLKNKKILIIPNSINDAHLSDLHLSMDSHISSHNKYKVYTYEVLRKGIISIN
ncbi:MAG: class I SAM-dependent methyltransferase [Oligoflexia bacterium]|nr:class I SAM-dependent methyltransferase [Oligoflexia bacterium]